MPIGKIEQFDLSSRKWSAYIRRVKQFIALNEIKEGLKVATLVTLVGDATYSLMCDLCAPSDPETKTFDALVKIVSDHLEPQRSEIAERHIYRQRRQKLGEPITEYLQALKHLASTCNFKSNLEENLRDQFVSGIMSDDMRSRLFAETNLTYAKAVELALSLEAAERHAQASGSGCTAASAGAAGQGAGAAEALHRVEARGRREPQAGGNSGGRAAAAGRACWRCGRPHRADGCRFKNYSCDGCGQKGHLKVMCKKGDPRSSGDKGPYRGHNYLDSEEDSECDLYNLNVCGKDDKPYVVNLIINGVKLMFELDTGSKLSTINYDGYLQYFKNVPLHEEDVCLRSYTGTVIKPAGYIIVKATLGEHTASDLKLFVIKNGGPPLLGRSWLRHLQIDKVKITNYLFHLTEGSLIEELRHKFPTVFAPGLGTCTKKMTLKLSNTEPVFIKARSLPLALRKPVELELERLAAEGTIYKVDYSDFGTPIVPVIKKSGDIRICGDYKITVNPKLTREPYPLPRIEELFAALSGGEQYSKIDLTNAYQQLLLEEDSQACTAITTHIGTFVYRRTPFGLSSIPEKFQKFMEETLRGLRGVTVFLDDIAVTGRDRSEHVANLEALFVRLRDVGLRIKLEKCQFMRDSITYVGFIIDKQGLHPDQDKIKAIVDAPAPSDITQLRSFLGLINYYAKFIPNLSSILYPLHRLLRKDTTWVWGDDCMKAFEKVKLIVASRKVLVHYDPKLPLVLAVDSSSYGLGSVLSHRLADGTERPICFASRTLTAAERAYSQLDKEALAIITGVIKHHQYLYGRRFIIKTDHKPLTFIFGPKNGLPQTAASRLQRYAIRLAAYDFDVEFVKSIDNLNVDALSRLPLPCGRKDVGVDSVSYVNYVEESFPISARDVAAGTQRDAVLKNIYKYIRDGWPVNLTAEQEKPYMHRREHLFIDGSCILYNHRVVIPDQLRQQVLHELHEGHQGVVKMKNIARGYVYWPQLDAEIEALCRACAACRQQRDAPPRAQLHPWAFPARPWQRLHVDFGEFQGKHYLVTVDAHSKWLEVQKMASTTAGATVLKLRELFARFGLPTQVVSDGGPPFGSAEFAEYMNKNRIVHTITSPYRPTGNGAAENAVKSVKRAMKKALHDGVDVDTAVCRFLFQYRNTEHCTTGVAPAEALIGRRLRGRLDAILPGSERAEHVGAAQERAGQRRPGAERHAQPGDAVLARDYRPRTGSGRFTNYANSQAEEDSFDLGSIRTGKRSGLVASIANLAKGALGGGVLSGHVAYMKSGFVSAIFLNFGFGFYLAACFYLLVKSAQILCKRCHVGYMTYPDLAEAALSLSSNPKMNRIANCYKHFIEFIICLNLYGSCAAYQLIIAKTIKQLVENTDRSDIAGLDGMPSLRVYVAIMIIPVILITLITELKYLAPFSILANAFVGFCVIMAMYYAMVNNPGFENMSPFNGLYNQVIYTGMAVFSMSSAGVILPVENNMKNPEKIGFVLFVGYILIIVSVFLCSFFGYVGYLENCRSPITINFPMTTFPIILKGCIAAMIYVTHALNFYMPFNTCFVYLKKWHNQDQLFKWELFYRALITLIISIIAIIFPSIDALMGFLGCFCLSNMAFIGPNFIYMVVVWERPGLGKFKWRLWRAIIFVGIGICILVCGTIVSSFEMVETFIESTKTETTTATATTAATTPAAS